jgi:XTP/dITP diphosphohydrolase
VINVDLLVATKNKGKILEVETYFKGMSFNLCSLVDLKKTSGVTEDGKTLEENAIKKALHYSKYTDKMVLADDSGLMVDCLNGAPGVHSARYAGASATDLDKCQKILKEMEGVPWEERMARFECEIALAQTGEIISTFHGECSGSITLEMKGDHGFGYDPIFYYPPLEKTFAELGRKEKEKVSHRGAALSLAAKFLQERYF